jgi:hypothetical protein
VIRLIDLLWLLHLYVAVEFEYLLEFADLLQDEHSLHALLVGEVEHLPDFVVDLLADVDYQLLRLVVTTLVDLQHRQPEIDIIAAALLFQVR